MTKKASSGARDKFVEIVRAEYVQRTRLDDEHTLNEMVTLFEARNTDVMREILKALLAQGVIETRKVGKYRYYRVTDVRTKGARES
jgi:hypothetical protein